MLQQAVYTRLFLGRVFEAEFAVTSWFLTLALSRAAFAFLARLSASVPVFH